MFNKIIILFVITIVCSIIIIDMLFSLDVSKTQVKKPADMIVVLGGGLGSRIERAWELQKEHLSKSDSILITGIPLNPEKVVNQHPFLKYLKDDEEIKYQFVSIDKTKNTWEEALYLKTYMLEHHFQTIIIVTHPLHTDRVKMSLDSVAHFNEAGLEYILVGDRKIDFWNNFLNDKKFRTFALLEVAKRFGYEVKALGYNIVSRMKKENE